MSRDTTVKVDHFCTVETKNTELHEDGLMQARFTFHRSAKDSKEIDDFLEKVDAIYSRDKAFVMTFAASSDISRESLANLRKIAEFMKQKQEHTRRLVKACAVILPNQALQKLVKAVIWIRKPACQLLVCDCQTDADAFLTRICNQ